MDELQPESVNPEFCSEPECSGLSKLLQDHPVMAEFRLIRIEGDAVRLEVEQNGQVQSAPMLPGDNCYLISDQPGGGTWAFRYFPFERSTNS